jgi:hypothetical protein
MVVPSSEARGTQVVSSHAGDDERRRDIERRDGVREAVRKRRIEDDGDPVLREEPSRHHGMAGGCLHPAVDDEDPERREQRPDRDHDRGPKMHPRGDTFTPEQQHTQKARFEEKSREAFISHQRTDDIRGQVGEAAPVGPELERHDDARHDAHAERYGEYFEPEFRQPQVNRAAGGEVQTFEYRDVGCESTVNAGSRICSATTQKNCSRDRNSASSDIEASGA